MVSFFSKKYFIFTFILLLFTVMYYFFTGKLYLQLPMSSFYFGPIGIGLYQGKIFLSSLVTFYVTLILSYFFLTERQKEDQLLSFVLSVLITLSGAYIFEFFYSLFNHQLTSQYALSFGWWFNLLAGLCITGLTGKLKINRIAIGLYIIFFTLFIGSAII